MPPPLLFDCAVLPALRVDAVVGRAQVGQPVGRLDDHLRDATDVEVPVVGRGEQRLQVLLDAAGRTVPFVAAIREDVRRLEVRVLGGQRLSKVSR